MIADKAECKAESRRTFSKLEVDGLVVDAALLQRAQHILKMMMMMMMMIDKNIRFCEK